MGAMILSLTVILICVITGAAVIICCFVSSCPMYDTCSGSWNDKSSAGSLFLGDRNGMKLPGGGDYMPAADMHPESLNLVDIISRVPKGDDDVDTLLSQRLGFLLHRLN